MSNCSSSRWRVGNNPAVFSTRPCKSANNGDRVSALKYVHGCRPRQTGSRDRHSSRTPRPHGGRRDRCGLSPRPNAAAHRPVGSPVALAAAPGLGVDCGLSALGPRLALARRRLLQPAPRPQDGLGRTLTLLIILRLSFGFRSKDRSIPRFAASWRSSPPVGACVRSPDSGTVDATLTAGHQEHRVPIALLRTEAQRRAVFPRRAPALTKLLLQQEGGFSCRHCPL